MHIPIATIACAGVLGLIFVALSMQVVMLRTRGRVMLGDGGQAEGAAAPLLVAIRSHANFAEFVPFCLILIGGLEMERGATVLVKGLVTVLVLARLAHPIGMRIAGPNALRAGGFLGTILVALVASVAVVINTF